jgi:hypothetical protein
MFTLEIRGKAIAVIDSDEEQARDLAEDDAFQDDLRSMESNGEKLWNGSDELVIRPATETEIEASEAALDEWDEEEEDSDDLEDEEEIGSDIALVFIVPIDGDLEEGEQASH